MSEKKLLKRQRDSTSDENESDSDEAATAVAVPVLKKKYEPPIDPVSNEIKMLFYQLSDPKEKERTEAVKAFAALELNPEQEIYVMKRLAAGCAAGGRASRLGYPPVLAYRLKNSATKFTIEQLEEIVNEKLPVDGKGDNKGEIIGKILFYTAVINSGKFKSAVELLKIAKILHGYYQKYNHIKFAIAMALVDIAKIVGEHFYSPHFSPVNLLPPTLRTLESLEPEQLFILLSLRKVLAKDGYSCDRFFKNGKFLFKKEYYPEIQKLLRKVANGQERYPLPSELYLAALDAGKSMIVIKEIFYPALNFDKAEDSSNAFFKVISWFMDRSIIPLEDVTTIFMDELFLKKLGKSISSVKLGHKAPHGGGGYVGWVLKSFYEYLEKLKLSSIDLAKLMIQLHHVQPDEDIDNFFDKSDYTKKLLSMLDENGIEFLINSMNEEPQDFIINELFETLPMTHSKFTIEHRIDLILKAAESSPSMVHETLCHLFVKPLRESQAIIFTDAGEETIQKLAQNHSDREFKKIKEKDSEAKKQYQILRNVSSLLEVFQVLSSDEDEINFCEKVVEQFEAMIEQKDIDTEEVFSRICEMAARKGKCYRLASFSLTTVFATVSTEAQLIKLAETIQKSNWAIVTGDEEAEEDDDEFAPITAEELAQIQKDREQVDSDAEDDEEEETDKESEDEAVKPFIPQPINLTPEDREPHPHMVTALRRALGKYAAVEDDNEGEDIEMNDEELAAVDERLSNVMKCFTSKGRKLMIQEAKLYRSRVAEILGLCLELASVEVVFKFLPKFFEILSAIDETHRQEVTSAFIVVTLALGRRNNKAEKDVSKSALKLFKQLCETSEKMHNAQMKGAHGNLAIFLYKSITDATTQKALVKFIIQEIEKYFGEGISRSSKYTVLFEIIRRYHDLFVPHFGFFFEQFKKTTKKSKKGEAANIVAIFNRKDVIAANQKQFASTAKEIFEHFKAEEKPKDTSISFVKS
jgi:translation initiation factor 2B subunit (eIF-2B alpha/beta/delta family)